eukprot:5659430-Lingulodinium_polyedra.AAC.1
MASVLDSAWRCTIMRAKVGAKGGRLSDVPCRAAGTRSVGMCSVKPCGGGRMVRMMCRDPRLKV